MELLPKENVNIIFILFLIHYVFIVIITKLCNMYK